MDVDAKYASLMQKIGPIDPFHLSPPSHHFLIDSSSHILIFTGIEFSFQYSSIMEWLTDNKKVIFLEKDLNKLKAFFNLNFAKNLIQSNLIDIYHYDSDEIVKQIGWQCLGLSCQIHGKDEDVTAIKRIIEGIILVAAEFKDFGSTTFRNVFQNVLSTPSILIGHDLFNKFKNIPAIIVGAGSSLDHEIQQLKAFEKHALVFGGGSALEVLSKENINVHFGATIDPDPSRSRFLNFTQFDTPFFVQFRMSKTIYKEIQGEKVWMGNSPGYPLEETFYRYMGLPALQFDGGWVVSNFLCHTAYLLGCNPIIFIGMDHSWTQNLYATHVSDKEEREGFIIRDMYGKDVVTRSDFFWANDWFSNFAKHHQDTKFINCTSQGLNMHGIEHMTLHKAFIEFAGKEKQLHELIHSQLQQARRLSLEKAPYFAQDLIKSIQTCIEYCQKTMDMMQHHFAIGHITFDEIEEIIPEITEEMFYQKVLKIMWEIWKYPHLRESSHPQVTKVLLFLDVLNTYLNIFIR